MLVRNIILSFVNPETNKKMHSLFLRYMMFVKFQIIFYVEMRFDFIEKNKDGVSDLYLLADFSEKCGNKIRKDEAYVKNYLTGKYGAIPELKPFNMITKENTL